MGLETAQYISQLDAANPASGDDRRQGDDHLRMLKDVLKRVFPNASKSFYFPSSIAVSGNRVVSSLEQNAIFEVDAGSAAVQMDLPALGVGDAGWSIEVLKKDVTDNKVNIVPPAASPTISGETVLRLYRPYQYVIIIWTGAKWYAHEYLHEGRVLVKSGSASYTLANSELNAVVDVVTVSPTTATVNLPTVSGIEGAFIYVRRNGTANVVIDPYSSETLNGSATRTLTTDKDCVLLVAGATEWLIVASNLATTLTTGVANTWTATQTMDGAADVWDVLALSPTTGTVTWDLTDANHASLILTGAATLNPDTPTALPVGQTGLLYVRQKSASPFVAVTWHSAFKWLAVNEADIPQQASIGVLFQYFVLSSNTILIWKVWSQATSNLVAHYLPISEWQEYNKGTLTLGGTYTQAHGLGRSPSLVQAYIKCKTTDLGYALGDYVDIASITDGNLDNMVPTVRFNDTNVVVKAGLGSSSKIYMTDSSGINGELTLSRWDVVIRVYK